MTDDFMDRYTIHAKEPCSDKTILRDNLTEELVLMREITICTHQDYKDMVEALVIQQKLNHPHLLSLLEYKFILEGVSDSGPERKVFCYFEYSRHPLDLEIQFRQAEAQRFEEQELWRILFGVVKALAYLQSQDIGHGSVSTSDIYILESGEVKICDPAMASSIPFQLSETSLYSPELLKLLAQDESIGELDIFRSDVFSLGMCMLQTSLLQRCTDCYSFEKGVIYSHLLTSKKIELAQYYSEEYCQIIEVLLGFKVSERPNFIQLQKILRNAGAKLNISSLMQTTRGELSPRDVLQPMIPDGQSPDCQLVMMAYEEQNNPDVDYNANHQRQNLKVNQFCNGNKSLVKVESFQSLASVRSAESKELPNTAQNICNSEQAPYSRPLDPQSSVVISSFPKRMQWSSYVYNPRPQQVFTDPALMQLVKEDLVKISHRKAMWDDCASDHTSPYRYDVSNTFM